MITPPPKTPLLPAGGFNRVYTLGRVLGLRITAETSAIISFIVLWVVLAVVGRQVLNFTVADVFVGGFIATALHFLSELLHQLGHALAAARTGYPMVGVQFWLLLARSIYPPNEPPLPARVHIRRALGGPVMSLAVAFVFSVLALLVAPLGGLVWVLVVFMFLDNLLVFGLGSFLPLGFTDGSTLIHWWSKR